MDVCTTLASSTHHELLLRDCSNSRKKGRTIFPSIPAVNEQNEPRISKEKIQTLLESLHGGHFRCNCVVAPRNLPKDVLGSSLREKEKEAEREREKEKEESIEQGGEVGWLSSCRAADRPVGLATGSCTKEMHVQNFSWGNHF